MKLRHYINKYKIRQKLPTILTVTACVGVIATGISSARGMYMYLKHKNQLDDDIDIKTAIRYAIVPSAIAAGTITSFIFARKADKAIIAGLSMATANTIDKIEKTHIEMKDIKPTPEDAIVLDEDGDLYYEPVTGLLIKANKDTVVSAIYHLNRNYQLRGICSLYEYFRLIGVKKADIYEHGVAWCKYIGWHADILADECIVWIDIIYDKSGEDCYTIYFHVSPYPICCDPPRLALEACHCDENDISEHDLDFAENVEQYIGCTIRDNDGE